jgi:hypothetical protein
MEIVKNISSLPGTYGHFNGAGLDSVTILGSMELPRVEVPMTLLFVLRLCC